MAASPSIISSSTGHLGWHWLFWIPESPVRAPGRVNWLAAAVMTVGMSIVFPHAAGKIARRYGSPSALIAGSPITAVGFLWSALGHRHPYDILISCALLASVSVWPSPPSAT